LRGDKDECQKKFVDLFISIDSSGVFFSTCGYCRRDDHYRVPVIEDIKHYLGRHGTNFVVSDIDGSEFDTSKK